MMRQVNIHKAKTHLSQLLPQVQKGEEIIIAKAGIPVARPGRLQLQENNLGRFITAQLALSAIAGLPVQMSHALHIYSLPPHRRDLFDRLLVAQAQLEDLPIITSDPLIGQYAVTTIW